MIPIFAGFTRKYDSFLTTTFGFTTAIDAGFTTTRSGTSATYIDSSGDWQQASANAARIHHDSAGNPLGLLIEDTVTNKANHDNFSPTTIGGIVRETGDGSVSVVADASVLNATIDGATIGDLSNGNVIALTGGTGAGSNYQVSLTTGTTNNHSYRVLVAPQGAGYAGNIKMNNGVAQQSYTSNNGAWGEVKSENFAVNATTRYLRVYVTAGNTVHIAAAQLEENEIITTPIITSGVSGTARNRDDIVNNSISSLINKEAGAVVIEAYANDVDGFFGLTDDDSASDIVGIRALSTDGFIEGQVLSAGSDTWADKVGKPLTDDLYVSGIVWGGGSAKLFHSHGATTFYDAAVTSPAVTLNDLWLGRWKRYSGYSDQIIIKKIHLLKGNATLKNCVNLFTSDIGKIYPILGQSNGAYISKNQTVSSYTNAGEVEALSQMTTYYSSGRNGVCNMAVGGSALYQAEHATLYWWTNNTLAVKGPLLENALEALKAHDSSKLLDIEWDQGEANGSQSKADIKTGVKGIIDTIRSEVRGDLEMIISPLGRRSDSATADAQYRRNNEAFLELASENSYIHLAPNKKVLPLYDETGSADVVHISDTGQEERVKWSVRKLADLGGESVSGPVNGPTIASATVGGGGGDEITINLTLPTGITDTSIGTGTEAAGFVFEDDGSPIAWTTAPERQNATTWLGVLASAPSGTQRLYHSTDTGYNTNPDTYIRGNDGNSMPLQISSISVS